MTVDCGSGNNNKGGLRTPTALAVTGDGKAVVVSAYDANAMVVLNRDAASGALTYNGCFAPTAADTCVAVPGAALNQPQGIAASPDGRSVYLAAFGSKAIARFSRDPDSGAVAYVGANTDPSLNSAQTVAASADGRNVYATSVQSTHAVSAFDRQGDGLAFRDCFDAGSVCGAGRDGSASLLFPYGLSVPADGRSVYTVHLNGTESTINRFDRDPRNGSLAARVGCFTTGTGCGPGNDAMNQLRGMRQVDTAPDGRDVYAASTGAVQLVRFHRVPDEPPACSPPASVSTAAGTPVSVALGCGDANGDAFSVGFPAGPGHGSLAPSGGSVAYTPASGFVGPDSFTVQPVDAFGVAGPVSNVAVTVLPLPDTAAPKVSGLTMPKALRAAPRGGSVLRPATAVGGRVRYALSEPATTTFTVEKKTVGRRSGRRCVKATRRNRKARRCTLYARQRGSFTHKGAAGANAFKFSGRLRNRKLAVASYRLVAVAADAAGNKSSAKRRAFRVVRR
jgi:DNA-binding beta-propeller fold protein YncE